MKINYKEILEHLLGECTKMSKETGMPLPKITIKSINKDEDGDMILRITADKHDILNAVLRSKEHEQQVCRQMLCMAMAQLIATLSDSRMKREMNG